MKQLSGNCMHASGQGPASVLDCTCMSHKQISREGRALQRLCYIGRPAAIPVPLQCGAKRAGSWRLHTEPVGGVRSGREVIPVHVRATVLRRYVTAPRTCAYWRQNWVIVKIMLISKVSIRQSAISAAPSHWAH